MRDAPVGSPLSENQEGQILKKLRRQVYRVFFGEISVLAIISIIGLAWGLFKAYEAAVDRLGNLVTEKVKTQFEDKNIRRTVENVAATEASKLLKSDIQPQISQFKTYLAELKKAYQNDYAQLAINVKQLQEWNEIADFGNRAILNGDRKAFRSLESISSNFEDTYRQPIATAEGFRVKAYYLTVSHTSGHKLAIHRFELPQVEQSASKDEASYSTDDLTYAAERDDDWKNRAIAVQTLANRKERGVAEVLLRVIQEDSNLEVVRDAARSFEAVTGSGAIDVFGGSAGAWWEQHGAEFTAGLPQK